MAAPTPLPKPDSKGPIPFESHAIDNLRYIRETMERAGSFTAVPGWGGVAMGATALGAAGLASHMHTPGRWLSVWLTEAVVALVLGALALWRKAQDSRIPLFSAPSRKFVLGFVPPLLTGGILTWILASTGMVSIIPGLWLMLYGVGVIAGGAFSVPVVPVMGICFLAEGIALALFPPAQAWADFWLGAGFGGLHVLFGAIIAKKYGG